MAKQELKVEGKRENAMLVTCAAQGTGKSYQNKLLICKYVVDKLSTKVRGRKVLILDVNSEYGTESFGQNGIPPLTVKSIAVKDVRDWCRSDVVEARRIDMKSLSMDDKVKVLNYVMENVKLCLVICEDINTVTTNMNELKKVVGSLVNLRHKGVDVIVSYQSLRHVEPRILANCRYVRLHYMIGQVSDIKSKLPEPDVFYIGQQIINKRYYGGDKRFFLYIHTNPAKIEGAFSKDEFMLACRNFLMAHKKRLKEEMDISGCSLEEAVNNQSQQLYEQFYGNPDKDK